MTSAWHSMHIAHHEQDMDALLTEAIAPLFARVPERAYVVRHWRRGPHLRVNVHCDAHLFADVLRPAAVALVERHLARHPSRACLDPERELQWHRRRAELEADHGPLRPWYPDNSVHDAPYEPPVTGFHGKGAALFAEDFYCATGPLMFDAARRIRAGQSRLGLLFDVWVATAHALSGEVRRGHMSYRSHADGFRYATGTPAAYLTDWERRFTATGDRLADRAAAVLETLDTGTGRSRIAQEWVAIMSPISRRARQLVESGELAFPEPPVGGGDFQRPPLSPFHRALARDSDWPGRSKAPEFTTYRVMLTLTYAHASRIGISLLDRFFLCHLAARTLENRCGGRTDSVVGPESQTEPAT